MMISDKLRKLGIKLITAEDRAEFDDMTLDALKKYKYDYVKWYGEVPMFYSGDYLNRTPYFILVQRDIQNRKKFLGGDTDDKTKVKDI